MVRLLLIAFILGVLVVLLTANGSAAGDVLDFFRLRDTIVQESARGRIDAQAVNSEAFIGIWARWRGRVDSVLAPRNALWLVLVDMDPGDAPDSAHDLEVWTDDPVAANLTQGEQVTVKGTIVDYRVLPGGVVHIVMDARG